MSYILDFEKMRAGDIILTSGESVGAKAIKLGTLCKYTHAMMYVGHTMIHAIPEGGVYSKNPQREIFNKSGDALVLRLKSNISAESLKLICDYARNLTGTLYSKREAVLTKALSKKDADAKSKMQFCSRLVAQAYEFVGIRLVNNPSYCAPKDLFESNLLEPVENVVRPASPEEVDFANTPDPTLENQKLTYIWLEQARNIAKSLNFEIHSISDVFNFLNSHPESDTEICEAMKKSGYLEHYKCDCEINPYRYDAELFVSYFSNKNIGIENAVMGEIKKEPGMINHMLQNYSAHVQLFNESNLEIHELHVELYKNILLLILQRVDVMKSAISSIKDSDLYSYIDNVSDVIRRNITSDSR